MKRPSLVSSTEQRFQLFIITAIVAAACVHFYSVPDTVPQFRTAVKPRKAESSIVGTDQQPADPSSDKEMGSESLNVLKPNYIQAASAKDVGFGSITGQSSGLSSPR